MDLRYHQYVRPDSTVYGRRDAAEATPLQLTVPERWRDTADTSWRYAAPVGAVLPVQGWKIHLSATFHQAQEVLDVVAGLLYTREVPFKVTITLEQLLLKNSKYGDRTSSGKFITVYPDGVEQFLELLDELHRATAGFDRGPFVLSDRRWRDGLVYYRYGAFVEMRAVGVDGAETLCIKDPDGTLVPDGREPVWTVPDFVEIPETLTEVNDAADEQDIDFPYDVVSALHFSNGGGVYKARHLSAPALPDGALTPPSATDEDDARPFDDGHFLVLKEGRPGAGIDAMGRDAVQRVRHESEILERLSGCDAVPQHHDFFPAWEHVFLVEEYIPAPTLNAWVASRYPFPWNADSTTYRDEALIVLRHLARALDAIHDRGIGVGDLQPLNVLVTDDLDVKLIDMECAGDLDASRDSGLMTLGYTPYREGTRRAADRYALAKIARQVFLPMGPSEDLIDGMWDRNVDYIRAVFGDDAADLVQELWDRVPAELRDLDGAELTTPALSDLGDDGHVHQLIARLRAGLLAATHPEEEQLAAGDIRQHEERWGMLNVRNGGAGMCLALLRSGGLPTEHLDWLVRAGRTWLEAERVTIEDYGLFTGGAGLAGVLWEADQRQLAGEVMDAVVEFLASLDHPEGERVTLDAGYAGIILQLVGFHRLTGDERYRAAALSAGRRLAESFEPERSPVATDPDAITLGLMEGWSGGAVALWTLARMLEVSAPGPELRAEATRFAEVADEMIGTDLNRGRFEDDHEAFTISDGQRLIPYLAGGSAGTWLATLVADRHDRAVAQDLEAMERGMLGNADCRSFYNAGLLRGTVGLLATVGLMETERGATLIDARRRLGTLLHNFFATDTMHDAEHPDTLVATGDFGYRISHDLGTGGAGHLCALLDLVDVQGLSWMPLADRSCILHPPTEPQNDSPESLPKG